MKSEELLRYQEMYREMERALKTRLLTFGFPRRAEWSREPRRREGHQVGRKDHKGEQSAQHSQEPAADGCVGAV
jgi:hypothetical protein